MPLSLGIEFSENYIASLRRRYEIHFRLKSRGSKTDSTSVVPPLPDEARITTPFEHITFDYNPNGHGPTGIWTFEHFDLHFYLVPLSVLADIVPAGPNTSCPIFRNSTCWLNRFSWCKQLCSMFSCRHWKSRTSNRSRSLKFRIRYLHCSFHGSTCLRP